MDKRLVLGTKSPRRRQIMEEAGYAFTVTSAAGEEIVDPGWDLYAVPEALALQKAAQLVPQMEGRDWVLLTCDTIVILGGEIIGKPTDLGEARAFLRKLSGATHTVVSGVCIADPEEHRTFADTTKVTFRPLEEAELDYYLANFEVMDKAGAYAIQEWIGMIGVEGIDGSYYNVMGLPVHKVYSALAEMGIAPFRT